MVMLGFGRNIVRIRIKYQNLTKLQLDFDLPRTESNTPVGHLRTEDVASLTRLRYQVGHPPSSTPIES
jgi:hypothetical protein